MIFSVFDHNARCFDYYEAPGTSANYGARGTKYRALTQGVQGPAVSGGLAGGGAARVQAIGFAPESLCLPLPSNAMPVGRGEQARGIIACVPSRSMAGLGATDVSVTTGTDKVVVETQHSFGKIVVAACVAGVVGVLVQKALK